MRLDKWVLKVANIVCVCHNELNVFSVYWDEIQRHRGERESDSIDQL